MAGLVCQCFEFIWGTYTRQQIEIHKFKMCVPPFFFCFFFIVLNETIFFFFSLIFTIIIIIIFQFVYLSSWNRVKKPKYYVLWAKKMSSTRMELLILLFLILLIPLQMPIMDR